MDLKSNHASPVLTENSSLNIPRLALRPSLLACSSPAAIFSPGLHLTVPRKKPGILDDVRSTGWLDAMKASSPPPKRISRDVNNEDGAADTDLAHRTWMVMVISAFFQLLLYSPIGRLWRPLKEYY